MITSENNIQIRYDEVDKMGYVYHGNYAKYYHISSTVVFVDIVSRLPIRASQFFVDKLKSYFENEK